MDESLTRAVRERTGQACEYCQLPEALYDGTFEVEHVVPRQHGGHTRLSNLAYACLHDNRHKGPNLTGIDPKTKKLTTLFNPRRHKWSRHFRWDGSHLLGRTPIGRVTVYVLAMNDPVRVEFRRHLLAEGLFPP